MAVFDSILITADSTKRQSKIVIHCLYWRSCLIAWGMPQFALALMLNWVLAGIAIKRKHTEDNVQNSLGLVRVLCHSFWSLKCPSVVYESDE